MSAKSVELKRFGKEQAGDRVGWVSVVESETNPDIVDINIVTATVSPGGAKYGLESIVYSNGESDERRTASGLFAATSLHTYISKTNGLHPNTAITFRSGSDAKFLVATGASYGDMVPQDSERTWANSPTELWGITREKLAAFDMSQHLPHVYYNLNLMSAHQDFRSLHRIDFGKPEDLLVPDASMHQATLAELKTVNEICYEIQTIIDTDTNMKKNLTIFSDIPVSQVPTVFETARQEVAERELRVLELTSSLAAPLTAFKPVGFRPSGRTWPYMNPLGHTEQEAYGIELAQLKRGEVSWTERELGREISEAKLRVRFARNGAFALRLLATAELG